ncbi:9891_t:CDS:1 [Ambispora leptoticha]|uniref:9891_t:CDS:1 n=1 Tax=Ambispora leptoticha TaxID=144679 RepID=A0A9N8YRT3_9GLOM|nr:9891_t:CDS:1 [Ambispora leptoticha]
MIRNHNPYTAEVLEQLQQNTVTSIPSNIEYSPKFSFNSLPKVRASLIKRDNGSFIVVIIDNQSEITIEFPLPKVNDLVARCSENQTRTGNAFLLFRSEIQRNVPWLLNNDISSFAGNAWQNSDKNLRDSFLKLEKKLKEKFQKKHIPFIQYTPHNITNRVKRRRQNKKTNHNFCSQRVTKNIQKPGIGAQNNSALLQETLCIREEHHNFCPQRNTNDTQKPDIAILNNSALLQETSCNNLSLPTDPSFIFSGNYNISQSNSFPMFAFLDMNLLPDFSAFFQFL